MTQPIEVIILLEELEIPYVIKEVRFEDVKKPPFIDINPNGRAPGTLTSVLPSIVTIDSQRLAIIDPNTDLTLWESGAIMQYLVKQYDTDKKLTCEKLQDEHLINQWLMFQMSGQGPYFGQCGWFNILHSEKIPSAIERYNTEVARILGVLERSLEGKQWLVGNKFTFADLSFAPWNDRIDTLFSYPPCSYEDNLIRKFPNVDAWHKRITERPAWKRSMIDREKRMDALGLMPNGMPKGVSNMEQYIAKMEAEGDA
ncbi:glutathione S-transferase protein [Rutstroemia sp. NJR-2017a WRK4]|nr:glutathione S-transferase protein [Rutstroemia sp. NJR-2017a WRK4]